MKVYLRFIHNISQNPEQDTEGPYETERLTLPTLWTQFKHRAPGTKSRARGAEPRLQDGGAVFFLRGPFHCMMIMPVGSALHIKHAPPSHFAPGGPLHNPKVEEGGDEG